MGSAPAGGVHDAVVVGSGTSGAAIARELASDGHDVVVLEAGEYFDRESYPDDHLGANTRLFWRGGAEPTESYEVGLLRPKCVGGGSVVNQALMDRFDEEALRSWRETSGLSLFRSGELDPYYERAEAMLALEEVPREHANRNTAIFEEGFEANGHDYHGLRRAQADCRYEDGNDCIDCLGGCEVDSKQSAPVTTLADAVEAGATVVDRFEVRRVTELRGGVAVTGHDARGDPATVKARVAVLAAGAIGNSRLLLASDVAEGPVGEGFYCHPQRMVFGFYDEPVHAEQGAFQAVASDDAAFREAGYKIENVFGRPGDVALLLPGVGERHQRLMRQADHVACMEVAVRDTDPGRIVLDDRGEPAIEKRVAGEDRRRTERGVETIRECLEATGAERVVEGAPSIGLHLMGGCPVGDDADRAVVAPDFRVHGTQRVFAADSSVFPDAPGINPALTIMALSARAADRITEELT